jgi:hypothetical protein
MDRAAPLLAGGRHLIRWVKSTPVAEAYMVQEPMYDGVEELWWADATAQEKDLAPADRLAETFIDTAATHAMFVDENRVVWEG